MKVLFVCAANTCRSPMLEFMFKTYLRARGIDDVTVDSAGMILNDQSMQKLAMGVLYTHGVPYTDRHSKLCDKKTYNSANFVFTMNDDQAETLKNVYGSKPKVYSLSELAQEEIFDPYGLGAEAYEEVYRIFNGLLGKIFDKIFK